jgi:hypothetical protein
MVFFLRAIYLQNIMCDIPTRNFCAIFLHEFSVRYSYTNFLCDIPTQKFCSIFLHEFSVRYSYTNFLRYTNFQFAISTRIFCAIFLSVAEPFSGNVFYPCFCKFFCDLENTKTKIFVTTLVLALTNGPIDFFGVETSFPKEKLGFC